MEQLRKTWIVEIVGAAILTALLGLWGWTATKVVQVSESVVEVRAELVKVEAGLQKEIAGVRTEIAGVRAELVKVEAGLQKEIAGVRTEIAGVRTELGREIATLNAKMDLLISGLNISVAPKDPKDAARAGTSGG